MSDDKTNHGFQPGVEVAYLAGFQGFLKRVKVAKIYSNGRFLLEGSEKQWKPSSEGYAVQAGERGYGSPRLSLLTPRILQEERSKLFRNRAERAAELSEKATPELLEQMREIVCALDSIP